MHTRARPRRHPFLQLAALLLLAGGASCGITYEGLTCQRAAAYLVECCGEDGVDLSGATCADFDAGRAECILSMRCPDITNHGICDPTIYHEQIDRICSEQGAL